MRFSFGGGPLDGQELVVSQHTFAAPGEENMPVATGVPLMRVVIESPGEYGGHYDSTDDGQMHWNEWIDASDRRLA